MKSEVFWLALTAMMTGVMFAPYILNRFMVRGIAGTLKNPGPDDKPQSAWGQRAQRAHANAVENLVIFAALVSAAQFAGISTHLTLTGCIIYFWSRLVHYVVYTLGLPGLRTLAFLGGVLGEVLIAITLIAAM